MKKKNPQKSRKTTVVRGISFPVIPFNLLEWADGRAQRKNRNVSNYIVDLILQDKQKEEDEQNG